MSKAEDYLDGLLNSMEGKSGTKETKGNQSSVMDGSKGEEMGLDDDFLKSFENDLLSEDDTDEFIRQFEKELSGENPEEAFGTNTSEKDTFFSDLDGIVNSAREELKDNGDIMVDTIGDIPGESNAIPDVPDLPASALGEDMKGDSLVDGDSDLMDLLQSDGDFTDIGEMLKADEENREIPDAGEDSFADFSLGEMEPDDTLAEPAPDEENGSKGKKRKKKEKKQKMTKEEGTGFFQKISNILFGDDEEEEKKEEVVKVAAAVTTPSIEELSDENLQILQELEAAQPAEQTPEVPEETEDPKEKKKKEKQEKKAKAKKERKEKQAQAKKARQEKKAKKEKKPKAPKEPDNTPPLPKKPVILIFVMVGSFLALVLIGTNVVGYSGSMSEAKKHYGLGEYEVAFQEIAGLELKEEDIDTYEKYRIMANASGEYSAYQSFMESGIYDMALDSLIRAVGRCDKYQADAEIYGCTSELERVRNQAAGALSGFGISEERALELYAIKDRSDYSVEVSAVLTQAGLSVD